MKFPACTFGFLGKNLCFFYTQSRLRDRMSGRRQLKSQGHIEPEVNLDDLLVHTIALRLLRCDLFQAMPVIPSGSVVAI
jgi:hypothetical protein